MKKDPNNAYGSAEARSRVLEKVAEDIGRRDVSDYNKYDQLLQDATRGVAGMTAWHEKRKLAGMAARNAAKRLNMNASANYDKYYRGDRPYPYIDEVERKAEADRVSASLKRKYAKEAPKKMAKGGSTASKRADGCATKGKTKGRFV